MKHRIPGMIGKPLETRKRRRTEGASASSSSRKYPLPPDVKLLMTHARKKSLNGHRDATPWRPSCQEWDAFRASHSRG
jgi:hypothetical protein